LDLLIVQAHVTSLITSDENPSILRVPYDEVRETVFDMDSLSAPVS